VLLWEHFAHQPTGYFVEIGANHPTKFSQTWFFEQKGWRGLLAEPISAKCEQLRAGRPGSRVIQAAVGAPEQCGRGRFHVAEGDDMYSGFDAPGTGTALTEEVEIRTLDDILDAEKAPRIDLLSIDVEGHELSVLNGFDIERHKPRVVLLEDHLQSLEVHRWMCAHGYRLVKRTGCNSWYLPVNEKFGMSSLFERFSLWKEIHLDTPIRIRRLASKA
jgi:FkbM family methyltransferase